MRKAMFIAALIAISSGIVSFRLQTANQDKGSGQAQQIDGIYVFYDCKPTTDFETIGTVKPGITLTGSPDQQVDGLIANAKKKFPVGEAILIADPGMKSAAVIKFK